MPAAGVSLTAQHYQLALKYCKYASSAMQYEDSGTAIDNLQKSLRIMTTGKESWTSGAYNTSWLGTEKNKGLLYVAPRDWPGVITGMVDQETVAWGCF